MTAASVTAGLGEARQAAGEAKSAATTAKSPAKPGFWARLGAAIMQARIRQAEREIAVYLDRNGGRFTDQMERRILERVTGIDRHAFGE